MRTASKYKAEALKSSAKFSLMFGGLLLIVDGVKKIVWQVNANWSDILLEDLIAVVIAGILWYPISLYGWKRKFSKDN